MSPAYIEQLGEDWAYGLDMRLFGYSVQEYMEEIGLGTYMDGYQETMDQNEQKIVNNNKGYKKSSRI